jgi:hypothetical protein
MSSYILLYTSYALTEEELIAVIVEAGGVLSPDLPYFGQVFVPGRLPGEFAGIWIDSIPCYSGVFDDQGEPLSEKDLQAVEQAKALLGDEFRSWLLVVLSRTAGTQKVAVHFAATFARHWPCVVDTLCGQLFSTEDIARLEQEGGHFTEYGL